MSNLGAYQLVTSTMKALGGPKTAGLIVGGLTMLAGYGVGKLGEKGFKVTKAAIADHKSARVKYAHVYNIKESATDERGLNLEPDDQFQVLQQDDDAVSIAVLEREDNPHVVSATWLSKISNFP